MNGHLPWRDGKFEQTGTSDFKTSHLDIGTVVNISRLNLGFRVRLNSAITRDWEYTDATTRMKGNRPPPATSGTDKIEDIPPSFAFGVGFIPRDWVRFSFDLEHTVYSKASHNYDSTYVSPDGI